MRGTTSCRRALALLAAGSLLLPGCDGPGGATEPAVPEEFQNMDADQVIIGLQQWLTRSGVRRAQLTADSAFVFPDSSIVQLRGVHVVMYDEQGSQSAEVTSRTGSLNTRSEAMIARGDVVLITREGNRRVMTEELHYDPQAGRIWSDVATTMIEPGSTLRGTGFRADTEFENVQVTNPRGRTEGLKIQL